MSLVPEATHHHRCRPLCCFNAGLLTVWTGLKNQSPTDPIPNSNTFATIWTWAWWIATFNWITNQMKGTFSFWQWPCLRIVGFLSLTFLSPSLLKPLLYAIHPPLYQNQSIILGEMFSPCCRKWVFHVFFDLRCIINTVKVSKSSIHQEAHSAHIQKLCL